MIILKEMVYNTYIKREEIDNLPISKYISPKKLTNNLKNQWIKMFLIYVYYVKNSDFLHIPHTILIEVFYFIIVL